MNAFCRKIIFLSTLLLVPFLLNATGTQKVIITEFMALNSSIKADVDGVFSDWIELYNPGETSIDLTGWHLTDEADNLAKWTFPSVNLGSGHYLLVRASGKDIVASNGEIHTNFKLSGSGEYLALVEPDTNYISFEYAPVFPAQQTNISYGMYLNQQTYFMNPTPGAENSMGSQILTPVFSVSRGFFTSPIFVTLSISDPAAKIYFTTDGTRPTVSDGTLYTSPLQISKTTPLSAVSIRNGVVSQVVSNTYFFVNDIVNQPSAPVGYPTGWGTLQLSLYNSGIKLGSRAPADYEMDPEICNHVDYKELMDDALMYIPTLSMVTNPSYLFSYDTVSTTGGIYIYTGDVAKDSFNTTGSKLGLGWERPTSVEYYDPSDSSQFQLNCGLLLHGGNSRKSFNTPKHSFRLAFRSEYGASKLNFDVFEEKKATNRFDNLVLRAPLSGSWLHNNKLYQTKAQFFPERFAKCLLMDMKQISGHDKYIHLYINGLYWGVYLLTERMDEDFMASYAGGEDSEYDVLDDDYVTDGVLNGNLTAFTTMLSKANQGNFTDLETGKLLDLTNFVDYMMMNIFIGNQDWDKNNWFTARNRVSPDKGFRYFSWDAETSLLDVNYNRFSDADYGSQTLTKMFKALTANVEFKRLVGDRLQKHFFNGGALTTQNTLALYASLAQKIDTALIAESARWGDYGRDVAKYTTNGTSELYTLNDHWIPRRNYVLNTYLPARSDIVYNQFKSAGFVSSLAAPSYNTRGGEITEPISVTISAPAGTIYYTVDGSDPRLVGGALNNRALSYSKALTILGKGTLKTRAKSGTVWSAINEVSFTSADTLHFVGNGSGLPMNESNQLSDIFYSEKALHYQLPSVGKVGIQLFTLDGRNVCNVDSRNQNAGPQMYECKLQPGIYLYRIHFNDQIQTGKLSVSN